MAEVLSVSELNHHIKYLVEQDYMLSHLAVHGEISNYKAYPSGHHYFSLKDAEGSVRCVMFRREASSLRFRPENGMSVLIAGRVSVFPRDGQYQVYCNSMHPVGMGDLHMAFEQIKDRLAKEGLFDPAHKKPLPRYPERIALVTSPVGAAVRDMLRVLGARYPAAHIFVVPVRVQGAEAKGEIAAAITQLDRYKAADLIIAGRGGGSMEDLWAFNEEIVARAIYACSIPIISAVGHEPDVTIADYVADLRAATPSNAAELAVPDARELLRHLDMQQRRLEKGLADKLKEGRRILERAQRSKHLQAPLPMIEEARFMLDYQQQRMQSGLEKTASSQRERLGSLAASLHALSPMQVLGRGYSLAHTKEGALARSLSQFEEGDDLSLRLHDGTLACRVLGKEPS